MKKITNLAVCIIARNEEQIIGEAIKSVKRAAEIIVIDDYSTDNTKKVSEKFGATVYKWKLNDNFSAQRNFALKKTKLPWVLFIDADEQVTPRLLKEIEKAVQDPTVSGYRITRKDIWLGKTLHESEWGNQQLLRLAQRTHGTWERSVHETWVVEGTIKSLKNPLIHNAHKSVTSFVDHIAFHSRLHSEENRTKLKKVTVFVFITYPIVKFLLNFLIRKGYRDGIRGFLYSMFMSLHSFVAWSHLYTIQNEKQN